MQFYEIFEELCLRDNVTPRKACIDMGFGNSAAATWKYRGSVPTTFNMRKIARYFNVSLDSLMNFENIDSIEQLKPDAPDVLILSRSGKDGRAIDPEVAKKYMAITFPELEEKEKPVLLEDELKRANMEVFRSYLADLSRDDLLELSKEIIDLAATK